MYLTFVFYINEIITHCPHKICIITNNKKTPRHILTVKHDFRIARPRSVCIICDLSF